MNKVTDILKFICMLLFLASINLNAQDCYNDIRKVFERNIELNNKFLSSNEEEDRDNLEKYTEEKLHPVLHIFQENTCVRFDSCLFAEFTKLLLNNNNSADEFPANSLGHIFICQTVTTTWFIKNMNKKDRDIIVKLLEFGFLNESMKDEDKDYSQQYRSLKNLKET